MTTTPKETLTKPVNVIYQDSRMVYNHNGDGRDSPLLSISNAQFNLLSLIPCLPRTFSFLYIKLH